MKFLLIILTVLPFRAFCQVDKEQTVSTSQPSVIKMRCRAEPVVNPPMFVVNGYIIENPIVGNKLNPAHIISLDITKGAEAITSYGEKAKFGVIKIIVKQSAFKELVDEGVIKPIL